MRLWALAVLVTFVLPPLMLGGPAAATAWLDRGWWVVGRTFGFLVAAILVAYGIGYYDRGRDGTR